MGEEGRWSDRCLDRARRLAVVSVYPSAHPSSTWQTYFIIDICRPAEIGPPFRSSTGVVVRHGIQIDNGVEES